MQVFVFFILIMLETIFVSAAEIYGNDAYGSGAYGSVVCGDSFCDSSESCSSCSQDCGACAASSSSSSGGSNTAGSGNESEPFDNVIDSFERNWYSIPAGIRVFLPINKTYISITSLYFVPSTDLSKAEIKIDRLKIKPHDVPEPEAIPYQYLQFTKKNISDFTVSQIKIRFKVPMEWMRNKGISDDQIALSRYAEKWNELDTAIVEKNDLYITYESATPGFSVFLIGARPEIQKTRYSGNSTVDEELLANHGKEKTNVKTEETPQSKNYLKISVIALAAVILIVALKLVYKKRKHKKENLHNKLHHHKHN